MKTYEIPKEFAPEAKALCGDLVKDIEKTHAYYKQQIDFIKQQYKIALRAIRPDIVSAAVLRELFDEAEMTVDSKVETLVEDDDQSPANPKKRKKKKPAIPDHLPRDVVEHDIGEAEKICLTDGSPLRPMGHDIKLELKYTPAKFEVI